MTSNGFCWPCPPCPPVRRSSPETPAWRTGQKDNEDKQNKMKEPWRRSTQREEAEEPKEKDLAIDSTNVLSGKNNRTRCENVKDGQIVWLPKMDQIKSDSLILDHEKHEATYNHPALVVRVGMEIAEIRPITSLNGQSLREKYGNNEKQHDVHVFIQHSRNKFGRFNNPNGSPSLNIAGGLEMVSPSYVRAEKRCWIEKDQLWEYSDVPMYLDDESINCVQVKLCDRIYEAETEAHVRAQNKARADLDLLIWKKRAKSCPGTEQKKPSGPTTAFAPSKKGVKPWRSAPAVLETTKSTEEKEAAEKPVEVLEETKTDKAVEAPAETEGSPEPLSVEEAAEPTDTEEGKPSTLTIDCTTTTDTEENPNQQSPQHLDPGGSKHPRVARLRRVKSLNPTEFFKSTLCFSDRHASI